MSKEYTLEALNLLDEYFTCRTAYVKQLKANAELAKDELPSNTAEESYLKVEQEILELMGAE